MKVEVIAEVATDITALLKGKLSGLYLVNNDLYLVDKNNASYFLWSALSDYINIHKTKPAAEITTEVEITSDGITPELLLQAIAVTQKPELAFK